ncbi:CCA tRNA nucleotidyltransferase [Euzebya pacifica]|uniref:CCA tRNA nucleotidyltransferase n=1 Tax=Euzebya pacifica TaxID=1608957 RepID=UPI0013DEA25C|nr:CCA tRNA nucleotidyltransferase [Euzebya pacifica]
MPVAPVVAGGSGTDPFLSPAGNGPDVSVLTGHPALLDVIAAFDAEDIPLHAVGGCVRDLIRTGTPGNDLDLTTPADTDTIRRLLDPLGSLTLEGVSFGMVRLCRKGMPDVEITRYRTETYDDEGSRKPTTRTASDLVEDLERRDFTVNAMAVDLMSGDLVDPFGGAADLHAGVLRAVGDPTERFAEDPLRVIRAIRFSAQRGWRPDPDTRAAAKQTVADGRLGIVSDERIVAEAQKILVSPHPAAMSRAIRGAHSLGCLYRLFPGVSVMAGMQQTASGMDRCDEPADRLAFMIKLSGPDPKAIGSILKRAKWPHEQVDAAVRIARLAKVADRYSPDVRGEERIHGHPGSEPDIEARRLVRTYSDAELDAAARIARADRSGLHPSVAQARKDADVWRAPLPVNGHDAMTAGLRGPAIGTALRTCESLYLRGMTTREDLLTWLR